MGRIEKLFNDGWEFQVVGINESLDEEKFVEVRLPHDWLIYDCNNLYADETG